MCMRIPAGCEIGGLPGPEGFHDRVHGLVRLGLCLDDCHRGKDSEYAAYLESEGTV
jgi:hypothetical protein